jgi:hypothetical protein
MELNGVCCELGNRVHAGGEVYLYLEQTSVKFSADNYHTYSQVGGLTGINRKSELYKKYARVNEFMTCGRMNKRVNYV